MQTIQEIAKDHILQTQYLKEPRPYVDNFKKDNMRELKIENGIITGTVTVKETKSLGYETYNKTYTFDELKDIFGDEGIIPELIKVIESQQSTIQQQSDNFLYPDFSLRIPLNDKELLVLESLCDKMDLDKVQIMKQALRTYQLYCEGKFIVKDYKGIFFKDDNNSSKI